MNKMHKAMFACLVLALIVVATAEDKKPEAEDAEALKRHRKYANPPSSCTLGYQPSKGFKCDGPNGGCTNVWNSSWHCGACGHHCHNSAPCFNGTCQH